MQLAKRLVSCGARGLPRLAALALLAPLLAFVATPATAQVRAAGETAAGIPTASPLTIGLWTLTSFDRAGGGFSHCAISAPYSNGVTLIVSVSADRGWRIGMADRSWTLDEGQPLPLALEMRGSPAVAVLATAVAPWMMLSQALPAPGFVDRLREAPRIAISTGAARFDLELRDLREALAVLEGCAAEREMPAAASETAPEARPSSTDLPAPPGLDLARRPPGHDEPAGGLPAFDALLAATFRRIAP